MVALLQRGIISLFVGLSTVVVSHTPITSNENTEATTTVVETTLPAVVQEQSVIPAKPEKAVVEFNQQIKNPRVASTRYWNRVAHCETRSNWKDRGSFAGGLGIYVGTWRAYGGTDFAPVPNKATKLEQIVIANRISIFGWQTKRSFKTLDDKLNNRPYFQAPVGFTGWGCIKNHIGKPQKKDLVHVKKKRK